MEYSSHIYLSNQISSFEQDCACDSLTSPIPGNLHIGISATRSLDDFQYHHTLYHKVSNLYQLRINQDFSLAFDNLGRFPLTVLDNFALRVLDEFQEPLYIDDLFSTTTDKNGEETITVVQKLIDLGLLQKIGNKRVEHIPETNLTTLTAWLHVTNECNLRCAYCYLRKTQESMSVERGQQSIDAVYRSAVAHSFQQVKLKYAGGESTLEFPLILQLHDYAEHQAAKLGIGLNGLILSNGIGWSDKMIEELRQRKIRLSISLDGIGDDHDVQRAFQNGRGSFTLVERSIERLMRQNFFPSITITVSQRNVEGLPKVVEYLLERSLPFTINFYRENEYSAPFENLAYQDDQIIDAMKKVFAKIEANLPDYSILSAITDRARLDTPHHQTCGVGSSYLVIDQNGNVAKCHMEIEQKLTDISVVDPLKIIQLDRTGIQNHSVDEKEGCRTCDWRYYCGGGCPALTHRVTGRYDVKSPNCRIYKAIFPDVLRLEGLRILEYANRK